MRYRVYSGPRGSAAIPPLERDRLPYKECASLDDALSWARHVQDRGGVVLLIDGDDGTTLSKRDIATALRHSESELPTPRG
jgi:hypothetical protein